MDKLRIAKICFITLGLAASTFELAQAAQGLYTNGQWDPACSKCWSSPRTGKDNHCKPTDCALQGYYHCNPQDPPLEMDDDPRLAALIKSGECSYVSNVELNMDESNYINGLYFCTAVLDKMAGRYVIPPSHGDAARFKMDFYLTHAKASFLRNGQAQLKLAMDYDIGLGTQQNRKMATNLYSKAAMHGVPFAQYAMGARYAYGIAMPKDREKAIAWLNTVLTNKPASRSDQQAQEIVAPCAIKLIERLTPT